MLLGSRFFTSDNPNTALDTLFFFKALWWWFQDRFLSRCIPTNLKDSFLQPAPILSISLFWMKSLSESHLRTFCFFVVMSSTKNIVKIVMRLEFHLWELRIKLGLILTPEEHHKLYLQERNLSPNSVSLYSISPCILYLLVIKPIFTL